MPVPISSTIAQSDVDDVPPSSSSSSSSSSVSAASNVHPTASAVSMFSAAPTSLYHGSWCPSFSTQKKLQLSNLRSDLIRQEETVIFALIERAQFGSNPSVYIPGALTDRLPDGMSLLKYFLLQTERLHARLRRYTSADEHAFFPDALPSPLLPIKDRPQVVCPNAINVNPQILSYYTSHLLPRLCVKNDDTDNGSASAADITALQAMSKRIHYGKFVAESKFLAQKEIYTKYIRQRDSKQLMELLTNTDVERKLLKRVHLKASIYGRDILATHDATAASSSSSAVPPPFDSSSSSSASNLFEGIGCPEEDCDFKVDPDLIVDIYRDFIIPWTKEVEVRYLLQRLDRPRVVFIGPQHSNTYQAVHLYFGKTEVEASPCSNASRVFAEVLSNRASYGVVPFEDSLGGLDNFTAHQLLTSECISVCAEVYVQEGRVVLAGQRATIKGEEMREEGEEEETKVLRGQEQVGGGRKERSILYATQRHWDMLNEEHPMLARKYACRNNAVIVATEAQAAQAVLADSRGSAIVPEGIARQLQLTIQLDDITTKDEGCRAAKFLPSRIARCLVIKAVEAEEDRKKEERPGEQECQRYNDKLEKKDDLSSINISDMNVHDSRDDDRCPSCVSSSDLKREDEYKTLFRLEIRHCAGALSDALQGMKSCGINLTSLNSFLTNDQSEFCHLLAQTKGRATIGSKICRAFKFLEEQRLVQRVVVLGTFLSQMECSRKD